MPVAGSSRSVQQDEEGIRVVPQSQTKLRFENSSTRVCSPWQDMEQE